MLRMAAILKAQTFTRNDLMLLTATPIIHTNKQIATPIQYYTVELKGLLDSIVEQVLVMYVWAYINFVETILQ